MSHVKHTPYDKHSGLDLAMTEVVAKVRPRSPAFRSGASALEPLACRFGGFRVGVIDKDTNDVLTDIGVAGDRAADLRQRIGAQTACAGWLEATRRGNSGPDVGVGVTHKPFDARSASERSVPRPCRRSRPRAIALEDRVDDLVGDVSVI
jgi:hypothetical protein